MTAHVLRSERLPTTLISKPVRVGLLGQFGVGNFGNDGSLEAMIMALRRTLPQAELTVFCTNPEVVNSLYGVDAVRLTRPPILNPWLDRANRLLGRVPYKLAGPLRAFLKLRGFDVLVLPGTGAFDDFGDTPFGMPYVFMKWLSAARLRRCFVAFVSIGAGPAYHPLSRFFFKVAVRTAHYRSFRDEISRDFVASLGADTSRDAIVPDLAFSLPIPRPSKRPHGDRLTIGLGVMNYRGRTGSSDQIYEDYLDKLTVIAERVLSRGYALRLLLGQDNDSVAAEDLLLRLRDRVSPECAALITYEDATSLHDVMAQMQATDVVVATRFHNLVCSLRVGVPVITLGYLEKHDVLNAAAGLADYCAHVERFTVEWLMDRLDRMLAEREACARRLRDAAGEFEAQLGAQENALARQFAAMSRTRTG